WAGTRWWPTSSRRTSRSSGISAGARPGSPRSTADARPRAWSSTLRRGAGPGEALPREVGEHLDPVAEPHPQGARPIQDTDLVAAEPPLRERVQAGGHLITGHAEDEPVRREDRDPARQRHPVRPRHPG